MTLVLTGLDIEEKAAWAVDELFDLLGGRDQFAEVDVRLIRFDQADAPTNEQATAHLRITVKDGDPRKVGRAVLERDDGTRPRRVRRLPHHDAAIGRERLRRLLAGARARRRGRATRSSGPTARGRGSRRRRPVRCDTSAATVTPQPQSILVRPRRVPLGTVCGARSGDKGGNANVGVWTRDAAAYDWLRGYLTVERLRELVPEAAGLAVRRYELPNLHALNFVIVGLLGEGVAASTRPDPQAKGLGEYLRSRLVDLPLRFLEAGGDG